MSLSFLYFTHDQSSVYEILMPRDQDQTPSAYPNLPMVGEHGHISEALIILGNSMLNLT